MLSSSVSPRYTEKSRTVSHVRLLSLLVVRLDSRRNQQKADRSSRLTTVTACTVSLVSHLLTILERGGLLSEKDDLGATVLAGLVIEPG